jgi:hypothetical protein
MSVDITVDDKLVWPKFVVSVNVPDIVGGKVLGICGV